MTDLNTPLTTDAQREAAIIAACDIADAHTAGTLPLPAPDPLPQQIRYLFGSRLDIAWEHLTDEGREYWTFQAGAVRRAVNGEHPEPDTFFTPGALYRCGTAPETPPEDLLLFRTRSVAANPSTGVWSAFGWIRTQADGDDWSPTILLQDAFADWTLVTEIGEQA